MAPPTNPEPPATLIQKVLPAEVCVLVADRNFDRKLRWSMTLCNLNADERCPADGPQSVIGSGTWDDPDLEIAVPQMCATIPNDGNLLGVAIDSYKNDQLHGLGGIYYGVSLRIGGLGERKRPVNGGFEDTAKEQLRRALQLRLGAHVGPDE